MAAPNSDPDPAPKLHSFAQHPTMAQHKPAADKAGLLPAWVNPDLERLIVIKTAGGSFRSWAESLVDLPAGALFARITGVTSTWPPSYSTTQGGRDLHLELNSNIHFTNHSCNLSLGIVVASSARLHYFVKLRGEFNDSDDNFSFTAVDTIIWGAIEPCTSIIAACLPLLGPVVRFRKVSATPRPSYLNSYLQRRKDSKATPRAQSNESAAIMMGDKSLFSDTVFTTCETVNDTRV